MPTSFKTLSANRQTLQTLQSTLCDLSRLLHFERERTLWGFHSFWHLERENTLRFPHFVCERERESERERERTLWGFHSFWHFEREREDTLRFCSHPKCSQVVGSQRPHQASLYLVAMLWHGSHKEGFYKETNINAAWRPFNQSKWSFESTPLDQQGLSYMWRLCYYQLLCWLHRKMAVMKICATPMFASFTSSQQGIPLDCVKVVHCVYESCFEI